MLLEHHRARVEERQVEELLAGGRDGVSALDLVLAARRFGLEAEGVELSPEDASLLPVPAILHWRRSHFVVLEGAADGGFRIVDPRTGRRTISSTELREEFSGVAIVAEARPNSRRARYLAPIVTVWQLRSPIAATLGLTALEAAACWVAALGVDRIYGGTGEWSRAAAGSLAAGLLIYWALAFWRGSVLGEMRRRLRRELAADLSRYLARGGSGVLSGVTTLEKELRLQSPLAEADATEQRLRIGLTGTETVLLLGILAVQSPAVLVATIALIAAYAGVEAARRPPRVAELADALVVSPQRRLDLAGAGLGDDPVATEHAQPAGPVGRGQDARRHGETARRALASTIELAALLAVLLLVGLVADPGAGPGTSVFVLLLGWLSFHRGRHLATLYEHHRRQRTPGRWWPEAPADGEADRRREALEPGVAIALTDVSFHYGPRTPEVVRGIDLEVHDGELVVIAGRSGAGKSTLAGLLLGSLVPSSGLVTAAARRAGLVDGMSLIEGTIRDNLTLGAPDLADRDVHAVCRLALLERELRDLPLGLDTPVLQGGAGFATGECRRLLIARAIAAGPGLLVLDDPLRGLDGRAGEELLNRLADLALATVVLTSELGPIYERADRSLRIEQGRLVEPEARR